MCRVYADGIGLCEFEAWQRSYSRCVSDNAPSSLLSIMDNIVYNPTVLTRLSMLLGAPEAALRLLFSILLGKLLFSRAFRLRTPVPSLSRFAPSRSLSYYFLEHAVRSCTSIPFPRGFYPDEIISLVPRSFITTLDRRQSTPQPFPPRPLYLS